MGMKRIMGRLGVEVSGLGMGCWAIGGPFWRGETRWAGGRWTMPSRRAPSTGRSTSASRSSTPQTSTARATASACSARHCGSRRRNVVIATKFGNIFDEKTRQITGSDASPACIRRACEASLRGAWAPTTSTSTSSTTTATRPPTPSRSWRRWRGSSTEGQDPRLRLEHGRPRERRRSSREGPHCAADPAPAQRPGRRPGDARRVRASTTWRASTAARWPWACSRASTPPRAGRAADDVRGSKAPDVDELLQGRATEPRVAAQARCRARDPRPAAGGRWRRARWPGSGRAAAGPFPSPASAT